MIIVTTHSLTTDGNHHRGGVDLSGRLGATLNVSLHPRGGEGIVETTRRGSQATEGTVVTTDTVGRPEREGEEDEEERGTAGRTGGTGEIKGAVPDGTNQTVHFSVTSSLIVHALICCKVGSSERDNQGVQGDGDTTCLRQRKSLKQQPRRQKEIKARM